MQPAIFNHRWRGGTDGARGRLDVSDSSSADREQHSAPHHQEKRSTVNAKYDCDGQECGRKQSRSTVPRPGGFCAAGWVAGALDDALPYWE